MEAGILDPVDAGARLQARVFDLEARRQQVHHRDVFEPLVGRSDGQFGDDQIALAEVVIIRQHGAALGQETATHDEVVVVLVDVERGGQAVGTPEVVGPAIAVEVERDGLAAPVRAGKTLVRLVECGDFLAVDEDAARVVGLGLGPGDFAQREEGESVFLRGVPPPRRRLPCQISDERRHLRAARIDLGQDVEHDGFRAGR